MPNRLYGTLAEAIESAPLEPAAAYYEMNPMGSPESRRRHLRDVAHQGLQAGLKVEISAAEATLANAHMSNLCEFAGATVRPGSEQPNYFRIKVCHPVLRLPGTK